MISAWNGRKKLLMKNTTIGEIVKWFEQKQKTGNMLPKFFPVMSFKTRRIILFKTWHLRMFKL